MNPEQSATAFSCTSQSEGYGQELIITLTGSLYAATAAQAFTALKREIEKFPAKTVKCNLAALSFLDDFGITALASIKKRLEKEHRTLVLDNMSQSVRSALDYYRFDKLGQQRAASRRLPSRNLFVALGDSALKGGRDGLYQLSFLGASTLSLLKVIGSPRSLRWEDTFSCMQRTGVDALPIVGLISFLLGLIMAFMSSVQLQQFGANIYVASLVSLSMTRELGPIMTCILVAGRSGSAFAAEIGSMKISEEIDALFTMGFDPHLFLVTPKLIASLLVVPMLTLFSDFFAILGGMLIGISMLDLTVSSYINQTISSLDLFDVFWGVGKSALFALLIAWIGCLRGFQAKGGAAAVGRATTSAVVSAIFLIILADSVFAVILRYWE